MKYTIIKITFLLLFGLVLNSQTNAQLCGQYGATLNIKTVEDKPVENATVQLLPLEKDETRGKTFVRDKENLAKFKIEFLEGHIIKTKYKLIVSAEDFETFEQEITFPHCERQVINVDLIIGSIEHSLDLTSFKIEIIEESDIGVSDSIQNKPLEQLAKLNIKNSNVSVLTGTIYDENGAFIPTALIIFKDKEGKSYKTKSNEQGDYEIRLLIGKYQIISEFGLADKCKLINKVKELKISKNEINRHDITMILKYDNESECLSH